MCLIEGRHEGSVALAFALSGRTVVGAMPLGATCLTATAVLAFALAAFLAEALVGTAFAFLGLDGVGRFFCLGSFCCRTKLFGL